MRSKVYDNAMCHPAMFLIPCYVPLDLDSAPGDATAADLANKLRMAKNQVIHTPLNVSESNMAIPHPRLSKRVHG